ncbi:MAG TPA: Ig-like domain-containing protein [Chitinophagaceae bacterium]|nr:Ig-like domain-containing protein [Chitinophagaceae bacterium]
MKRVYMIVAAAICLAACKKDGGDGERPFIEITSPLPNEQFNGGETVNVSGSISDNDELREVHVIVTNKSTGAELVHLHQHVNVSLYPINQLFMVQAGVTYTIRVEAYDDAGNHAEAQFDVRGK